MIAFAAWPARYTHHAPIIGTSSVEDTTARLQTNDTATLTTGERDNYHCSNITTWGERLEKERDGSHRFTLCAMMCIFIIHHVISVGLWFFISIILPFNDHSDDVAVLPTFYGVSSLRCLDLGTRRALYFLQDRCTNLLPNALV